MGKKAAPRRKPGKWDKPERQAHATKAGPGRKAAKSHDASAPRVMVAPEPTRKLLANVGGSDDGGRLPFKNDRRVWREGEPVHIVRPARAARLTAKREQVLA